MAELKNRDAVICNANVLKDESMIERLLNLSHTWDNCEYSVDGLFWMLEMKR